MKVTNLIKNFFSRRELPKFDESIHKVCNECGGGGIDFMAGPCVECDGNGFVDKARSELWEEKLKG